MPLGNASVAERIAVCEEETVVSLLKDISVSLASIKNQNFACTNQSKINDCECQRRSEITNRQNSIEKDTKAGGLSVTRSFDGSVRPVQQSVSNKLADTASTTCVPYGEPSPLDDSTLTRFALNYNGILDRSDVLDRLNRLPPDDFRHQIPATKGNFLRQFMLDSFPSDFSIGGDVQLCLAELKRFEDFQIKLGIGHFWVRDYDSKGVYTQWDCVNLPSLSSVKDDPKDRQCEIPASEWPLEWLTRREQRPIAPWRRIIACRGLSRMVDSNGIIRNPYFSDISQPASMHLHRRYHERKLTDYRPNIHKKRGCLFQLTYAKNSTSSVEVRAQSAWHGGSLYPGGQHRSTEFQSITIDAISDRPTNAVDKTLKEPDKYWTILLMDPVTWYNDLEDVLKDTLAEESSMQVAMLVLVGYALRTAAAEWQQMASYFDTLVGENLLNQAGSTLLSPEKHDLLLFEDESFSRSRKYFWIVEAATTFMEKITDSLYAWERYRAQEVDPYLRLRDLKDHGKLLAGVGNAEAEVEKLKAVQHQLEKHLERTKLLRDGLFNASAVIESRAASELGRNVKLLTYVSIFYLPLSFCTSLWSTTETFSFRNLAIVTTLVALTTYVIVFNVEHIVQQGHDVYSMYRKKTVERMKADLRSRTWTDRAKRFDRFEPNRRSTKPTDWYVLWAGFLLLLQDIFHIRWLGLLRFSHVCPTCLGNDAQDQQDEESDSAEGV